MTLKIREVRPADEEALVDLLADVHQASGFTYPPCHPAPDKPALSRWLLTYEQPGVTRFIALDESDAAVGHVAVMPLDEPEFLEPYLREHDLAVGDYLEICKLFASPRTRGVGSRLLAHADSVIDARGKKALLYVLDTGQRAIDLYRASGWLELSPILGAPSGVVNHVFVNEPAPARASTPRVHPHAAPVLNGGRPRTADEYKSARA